MECYTEVEYAYSQTNVPTLQNKQHIKTKGSQQLMLKWAALPWTRGQKLPQFRNWHYQTHCIDKKVYIFYSNLLIYAPNGLINKRLALAQIMAGGRTNVKPFSGPMVG